MFSSQSLSFESLWPSITYRLDSASFGNREMSSSTGMRHLAEILSKMGHNFWSLKSSRTPLIETNEKIFAAQTSDIAMLQNIERPLSLDRPAIMYVITRYVSKLVLSCLVPSQPLFRPVWLGTRQVLSTCFYRKDCMVLEWIAR